MFGKKKQKTQINQEQLALIENAQRRVRQKKRFYIHFTLFVIFALLLYTFNVGLGYKDEQTIVTLPWSVIIILGWVLLLFWHFLNVFLFNKFMGKDWEKKQIEKLVERQQNKIDALENKIIEDNKTLKIKAPKNLTIIVAAGENNEIGKDNNLIWHLSDDLKRFKALTSGHHIIMGRKTFESFPKPLPNRTHIVISRQKNYQVPAGVLLVNSIEDAIDAASNDNQPYIIGGGEIYKQALPFSSKIELTRVHATFEADTFFPEINMNEWKETDNKIHSQDENHEYSFSFLTYERR